MPFSPVAVRVSSTASRREQSMKTPIEGTGTDKGADWLMRRSMQSSVAARHCSVARAALSFSTIPFAAAELCRGFAPGMRPTLHNHAASCPSDLQCEGGRGNPLVEGHPNKPFTRKHTSYGHGQLYSHRGGSKMTALRQPTSTCLCVFLGQFKASDFIPVGRCFLCILKPRVQQVELMMSCCQQDLKQCAPLLRLPCMQPDPDQQSMPQDTCCAFTSGAP